MQAKFFTPLKDGWYSFSLDMRGKTITEKSIKMLGRALFKISLGTVALSQGREQACDPRTTRPEDLF